MGHASTIARPHVNPVCIVAQQTEIFDWMQAPLSGAPPVTSKWPYRLGEKTQRAEHVDLPVLMQPELSGKNIVRRDHPA
jgi:hypothetical protein